MTETRLLSLEALRAQADAGGIDTVLACLVDMQGRLMGKRFHVRHFLDGAHQETHCCNYLLATDLAMHTVEGYASAGWGGGYGDYVMRPDLSTLRRAPWLEKTALILCDVRDHHSHAPVAHSPRAMLARQIERLAGHGLTPRMATELEFFLFRGTPEEIRADNLRLRPFSDHNEDYHILQTSREEFILQKLRNALYDAGLPVEGTKGEAEAGQAELNLRYGDGLDPADWHVIAKHAVKEIAAAQGCTASFLSKWARDRVGSASHAHMSLLDDKGDSAFFDPQAEFGMSRIMRAFVGGQLKYASDVTALLAPYVNSYKRFQAGSFAPTRKVWSVDNRTAGFRLVGAGSRAVRMECRLPGADMTPHVALAALLAAGLAGIEEELSAPPPFEGDAYAGTAGEIPKTLRDATATLRESSMLRAALGDAVVDHYVRAAEWEQEGFDAAVTDWEIRRGFELA